VFNVEIKTKTGEVMDDLAGSMNETNLTIVRFATESHGNTQKRIFSVKFCVFLRQRIRNLTLAN